MAPTSNQSDSSIASRVSKRKRPRVASGLAALFASHHATAGTADGFDNRPVRTPAAAEPGAARAASRRRLLVDYSDDDSSHRCMGDVGATTGSGGGRGRRPTLLAAAAASTGRPSARPSASSRRSPKQQQDIATIQTKLGKHKHHGTGNPLAIRSPTTPKTMAVDNLAAIIQSGHLGQDRSDVSGSIPQLRTERGRASMGSFWVSSVELAGHYGWTGLILRPDVDSSGALPISEVLWFVLETDEERQRLQEMLLGEQGAETPNKWEEVRDRVVTLSQLAERISAK